MGSELEIEIPAWIPNFTSKMRTYFISDGYQGTNHSRNLDLHDYGCLVSFMLRGVGDCQCDRLFEVFR